MRNYGHREFPPTLGSHRNDFVIQIDDYGQFWDPNRAEEALESVEAAIASENTVVALFIHGWHHNAAPDDRDLLNFTASVKTTRELLNGSDFANSRAQLTGSRGLKVIGIYVGWRGRSLPDPLDYLTFWRRKSAAERVGRADFRALITRLDRIYRKHREARLGGRTRLFLGLASFGHSFGGQVLFQSVVGRIEHDLIANQQAGKAPISDLCGFGDLIVLLNPALEALQYERVDVLARSLHFDARQPPLLLTLSSEADKARKRLFPLGRRLDAWSRATFRPGQKALWTKALGEHEKHVSHRLDFDAQPRLSPQPSPASTT